MKEVKITFSNEPVNESGLAVSIEIVGLDLCCISNLHNLPEMVMEQYRYANKLCGVPDEVTEKILSKIHCEAQSQ